MELNNQLDELSNLTTSPNKKNEYNESIKIKKSDGGNGTGYGYGSSKRTGACIQLWTYGRPMRWWHAMVLSIV
jgi:hypothetical protein